MFYLEYFIMYYFRLDQIGLNLIHVDQTCSNWIKLDQTGSNLFKLVQTCSNLFKLDQTQSKWSNLFKLDLIRISFGSLAVIAVWQKLLFGQKYFCKFEVPFLLEMAFFKWICLTSQSIERFGSPLMAESFQACSSSSLSKSGKNYGVE